ncbi:hypothetical protein J4E05_16620 [Thalassospira sp. NFXS8]|uniref:hypothetical protein n=1 Tax=Thalassospira sp. NFXS8 TaxID=2819093 RepID=UPI0032DE49BB
MRVIRDVDDLKDAYSYICESVFLDRKLPEKVFSKELIEFLFIAFDDVMMPFFFKKITEYLRKNEGDRFWMMSLDPDPYLYFGANYNYLGAVEFFSSDTEEDYISALNDYPENSFADALAHNANLLVFFSPEKDFVIYCDRDADIGICAFKDAIRMQNFMNIYGEELLGGKEAAAYYAYGEFQESEKFEKFIDSYA